ANVIVIRNETNRGFPAGCNQGLARASGRYLVFLNNDTVVTEGWLQGLIGWSLHEWPSVGLVGPMTSYASPPQQIAAGYDTQSLAGLDAFATERQRAFAGKAVKVDRLTGFCLLVRREVVNRLAAGAEKDVPMKVKCS